MPTDDCCCVLLEIIIRYQTCAVTDAAAVLLDADSGIIREAFDEDRAFWHRNLDHPADEQLQFFQAWARLRLANVRRVVNAAMAELPVSQRLVSCGTAQPGDVLELCSKAVRQLALLQA